MKYGKQFNYYKINDIDSFLYCGIDLLFKGYNDIPKD